MHVVVVGAGVFGAWTAHHLLAAGAEVTLIDAYGPGNSRASSGDETRILRCGYGPDRIYSEFAFRSLAQWRELDERVGRSLTGRRPPLWHGCGVLWMAPADDPYFAATVDTLRSGPYRMDLLTPEMLLKRYPLFRMWGPPSLARRSGEAAEAAGGPKQLAALLEPDCGILMARRSVQALCAELDQRGVRILRERVGPNLGPLTSDFRLPAADAYVFACGAWLGKVFPDLLGGRIRPTRQVVVYFGAPAGDDRFSPRRMPAWIMGTSVYGTPDAEGCGVKVGTHDIGPAMDPDSDDRAADAASIEAARAWLAEHIPALADAPVTDARVCQYENTDTGDFLIDRHPDRDNVWIVGGGSGHGFKHGPAVGELAARLVTTGAATEPRFALQARGVQPARRVY